MNILKTIKSNLRVSKRIKAFNLLGLSISFGVFIILALYIYNEYTFDSINQKSENIYLIEVNNLNQGRKHPFLPNPLGDYVEDQLGDIKSHCTIKFWEGMYSKKSDIENTFDLSLFSVDSTFTSFFTFNIIRGNKTPLYGKDKIILSQSAAIKIFGDEDPIGKQILKNYREPLTVEAVYEDLPVNSSFYEQDGFCSFITYNWVNEWSEWSFFSFVKLADGANVDAVNAKLNQLDKMQDNCYDDDGEQIRQLSLTPLSDLHFKSAFGNGNIKLVNTLSIVSILLLVMAFVNYLNFSFADLPKRIKNVSLRKISGGSRNEIYLHDSFVAGFIITVAFIIGLGIAQNILHLYPDLFGYEIKMSSNISLLLVLYLLLFVLGVALYLLSTGVLNRVEPIKALKGMVPMSIKRGTSKMILPVMQYVVAITLLAGVLLIYKQLDFIKNYDLGFEKENILVLRTTSDITKSEDTFADELLKNPNISDYAYSQFVPGEVGMGWGRSIDGKIVNYKAWPVDERYLNFMGFDIVKGRTFSSNIKADENNFIFNEAAVTKFGWQDSIIGKKMPGFDFEGDVVGVVKDMKYASLYEEVEPMCFWLTSTRHNRMSLKVSGNNLAQTINYIEETYSKFEKRFPINYFFLDESLNKQYLQSEKQGRLIIYASIIALFIALVGSLGMVIYSCEYRVKEIGVRKANGATTLEIVKLLNKSIITQVLVAFILALPLIYYSLSKWLESFAYKTEVSWWIYFLSGIMVMAITILSISWQSWKAATRNPIEALRYE